MKKAQQLALGLSWMLLFWQTADAAWQGSWLAGISTSYASRRGDLNTDLQYLRLPFFFPTTVIDDRYSDVGMVGGILAGYQIKQEGWRWAAELQFDWDNIDEDRTFVFSDLGNFLSWGAKARYHREPVLSFLVKMSYEMAPYFIPYIHLGLETSQETLKVAFSPDQTFIPFTLFLEDSRRLYRYLAGAGVQTPVFCTPLSLRLEYNFHSRSSALESSGIIPGGNFDAFFAVTMRPRENAFKASLVWNFV